MLRTVWAILGWTLVAVGAVLAGAALWIRRTFGAISVDQMLTNIAGAENTGSVDYIGSFVWTGLVAPLGAVACLALLVLMFRRRAVVRGRKRDGSSSSTGPAGFKRMRRLHAWAAPLAAIAICAFGTSMFVQTVGLDRYVRSFSTSSTMADYYVTPDLQAQRTAVAGNTENPKNLVLIFLESTEDQMGNEELFELNMLEPVQEATRGWQTIEDYQQYDGGGWTMAGLIGTSCGVPLRGAGISDADVGNGIGTEAESYLPGAVCLGDVLASNGYRNVFLGGADAQFAAKANFFHTHGYDEVKDLNTWEDQGETDISGWGLSDHRLMELAAEEVDALHASGQPFNLTMLTVDAHEPTHIYEYCPVTTEDPLESVIHCSMDYVGGFIRHMEEQGYLDDTVVVVTGDHQKLLSEGFISLQALRDVEDRPVFNRIWSPDGQRIERSGADQLSMYPTILDLVGLGRPDHRAGIGVSALVDSQPGSILDLDPAEYTELVESRSPDLYRRLWAGSGAVSTEAARGISEHG
ncbi:sulfatase-like hydrolase/transferase [Leucobacter ruminantium]|uniref:LTA synthase family protein n=1 Tax=Leucobacter ruminantium TaxID=1289170 RepID=A0A939LVJ6_9MICO|nr:LTA synthase family protein [Leucobacter ruminantium]